MESSFPLPKGLTLSLVNETPFTRERVIYIALLGFAGCRLDRLAQFDM